MYLSNGINPGEIKGERKRVIKNIFNSRGFIDENRS